MLAEANRPSPGRWVVMPRKGERFVGRHDRERLRLRDRRRRAFTIQLEAIALTVIMGMFPPLRPMLVGTGILIVLLAAYAALLVNIKAREAERRQARRRHVSAWAPARSPGQVRPKSLVQVEGVGDPGAIFEAGVRLVDDDVHVIVRRADEIGREPVGALA